MNSNSLSPWPFKGWNQLLDQHISIISRYAWSVLWTQWIGNKYGLFAELELAAFSLPATIVPYSPEPPQLHEGRKLAINCSDCGVS